MTASLYTSIQLGDMRGMRFLSIFPFLLVACGQEVTTAPADCGVDPLAHADGAVRTDAGENPRPDVGVLADVGAQDTGAPDSGLPLACHVDRFSACADPLETNPNNSSSDATYRMSMPGRGCESSDTFTAGTDMLSGRVCHTEPGDWFEYTYMPCDTLTMIAELRVRVTTPCERDAWTLTVANRPCDGSNPDVQCTWEGEWRVVRALLRPSSSIGLYKFGIEQPGDSVAFDYEATLEFRR